MASFEQTAPRAPDMTFRDLALVFGRIGVVSFGGPAAQIALMHRELVEERPWFTEPQFLRALSFCMLLPGPEAQQLATYIGWRMNGTLGGVAAGALFVIPSIFVMLLLSYLAVAHIDIPAVAAAFYGIQPVVVAVVVEAVLRIGKKALKHRVLYGFAALAFIAIFFLKVSFPYIVAAAAAGGLVMQRVLPRVFCAGAYDPETKGGWSQDGRKVKGTLHWVSAEHSLPVEVRLYEHLFVKENPAEAEEGKDFTDYVNPQSLEVLKEKRLIMEHL